MNYIFDFETLSTDRVNGVIVSMAILEFDTNRFNTEPYEYSQLLDNTGFIKFDVEDQVKSHGRKIDPDTLKWWGEQSAEARAQLKPSENDKFLSECIPFIKNYIGNTKVDKELRAQLKPSENDKPLSECIPFINDYIGSTKVNKVFSRGNTFDPIILDYIGVQFNQAIPWGHWAMRDTRSIIDGMAWGTDIKNGFIPDELQPLFVAHDPTHDIAMDVMRMQFLSRALG
jgi:hypothetical protein